MLFRVAQAQQPFAQLLVFLAGIRPTAARFQVRILLPHSFGFSSDLPRDGGIWSRVSSLLPRTNPAEWGAIAMRLPVHEFESAALKDRGLVSGGFCRRKGYTDSAARRVMNSHWAWLATAMEKAGLAENDRLRKEFSDAFWDAYRPNRSAERNSRGGAPVSAQDGGAGLSAR